jgi:hypothetical protein
VVVIFIQRNVCALGVYKYHPEKKAERKKDGDAIHGAFSINLHTRIHIRKLAVIMGAKVMKGADLISATFANSQHARSRMKQLMAFVCYPAKR